MPLDAAVLGREIGTRRVTLDARWLMAYGAGVPDTRPELYDTRAVVLMHPMFPVAVEWDLVTGFRSSSSGLTPAEASRGVHAAHDVVVVRPARPGDELTVTGRIVGVDRRRGGAEQRIAFDAVDAGGAPVWHTLMTSVFRGVELVGDPGALDTGRPAPLVPAGADAVPVATVDSTVGPLDAHTYTECARIWNPIHTDLAYAQRAGLHAPILHGTATLARGVSLATALAGVPLARVGRVAGDFVAMVDLDSRITVRVLTVHDDRLCFDVRNAAGEPAVRNGVIGLR